jgi:hypothetical protein
MTLIQLHKIGLHKVEFEEDPAYFSVCVKKIWVGPVQQNLSAVIPPITVFIIIHLLLTGFFNKRFMSKVHVDEGH